MQLKARLTKLLEFSKRNIAVIIPAVAAVAITIGSVGTWTIAQHQIAEARRNRPTEAKLEGDAAFAPDAEMVFVTPDVLGWDGPRYRQKFERMWAYGMVMNAGKVLTADGIMSADELKTIEAKFGVLVSELYQTACLIPFKLRIRNSGDKATTVEETWVELPLVSEGKWWISEKKSVNWPIHPVPTFDAHANGVEHLEIPLRLLLREEWLRLGKSDGGDPKVDEAVSMMLLKQLDVIDPAQNGVIKLRDARQQITSVTFPLRPLEALLKKSLSSDVPVLSSDKEPKKSN